MEGKVYLIGCGIAKEHLTVEAINAIAGADIMLYDRLIDKKILNINKKAKKIYVGKKLGESERQNFINKLFLRYKNKKIVRLHSGDPFIFGRGYEECLFLRKNKINAEIIPGISAFHVLDKLKIPITYRKTSSSVALITGSRADKTANYSGICADTLVFYMPVLNLEKIIKRLKQKNKHVSSDFILIENAFKENYRIINGKIGNILQLAREAQIEAPSLLVIGRISRKIEGNKVLLFRQKEAEKETKNSLNKFKVVNIPLIKIKYKKINKKNIPQNRIYAFTSPNAVKSVFSFSKLKLYGKFIAIGNITKKTLAEYGKKAIAPGIQTSNGLMGYLKKFNKKDIIVFCSRNTNVRGFRKVYCYNTIYLKNKLIKKSIDAVDTIFPTSSEILAHLARIVPIKKLNKKIIVVIGPKVALEAKKYNLHVDFMLEKPDISELNKCK